MSISKKQAIPIYFSVYLCYNREKAERHSAVSGKLPGGRFQEQNIVIDYDTRQIFIV